MLPCLPTVAGSKRVASFKQFNYSDISFLTKAVLCVCVCVSMYSLRYGARLRGGTKIIP